MGMNSIIWLALFVILLLIELATLGLTTIWFAAGCIAAFAVSMLGGNLVLQILAFLVIAVVMLIFTRPFAMRYINTNRAKTNIDGLVGKSGIVTGPIDNLKALGQVTLNGVEWTARAEDDKTRISEGKVVVVQGISGVKLIVKVKED